MEKQKLDQPSLSKPQKSNSLIYLLSGLLLVFVFLCVYLFFAYTAAQNKNKFLSYRIQKLEKQIQEAQNNQAVSFQNVHYRDNPQDWRVYRDKDDKYTIKMPVAPNSDFFIEIQPIDELKSFYKDIRESGKTCPGVCGELTQDKNLLDKQFEILAKSINCPYSKEFKKEIMKEFILYQGDPGGIRRVSGIYSKNLGICGMKFTGYASYDAWLGNYYYQAVFLKDNRIIHFNFILFPVGVFSQVDALWKRFGLNLSSGECDAECTKKEEDYYDNFQLSKSKLAQDIIKKYDMMIESFKLID